jgi:hypothetical protein
MSLPVLVQVLSIRAGPTTRLPLCVLGMSGYRRSDRPKTGDVRAPALGAAGQSPPVNA